MHQENFFSSWMMSDEEGRAKDEEVKSGKRNAHVQMERNCVGSGLINFSIVAFLGIHLREVMWLIWFGTVGWVKVGLMARRVMVFLSLFPRPFCRRNFLSLESACQWHIGELSDQESENERGGTASQDSSAKFGQEQAHAEIEAGQSCWSTSEIVRLQPEGVPPPVLEDEIVDANPPWSTFIRAMESYLEKSEGSKWESASRSIFWWALEMMKQVASCPLQRMRAVNGSNRFAVIETSRGHEVAEVWRCAEAPQKNRIRYGELRGGINHLKSQQNISHDNHGTQEQVDEGDFGGYSESVPEGDPELGGEAHGF